MLNQFIFSSLFFVGFDFGSVMRLAENDDAAYSPVGMLSRTFIVILGSPICGIIDSRPEFIFLSFFLSHFYDVVFNPEMLIYCSILGFLLFFGVGHVKNADGLKQ